MDSYMHLLHHCAKGPAGSIASAPLYQDEHVTAAIEAGRGKYQINCPLLLLQLNPD